MGYSAPPPPVCNVCNLYPNGATPGAAAYCVKKFASAGKIMCRTLPSSGCPSDYVACKTLFPPSPPAPLTPPPSTPAPSPPPIFPPGGVCADKKKLSKCLKKQKKGKCGKKKIKKKCKLTCGFCTVG